MKHGEQSIRGIIDTLVSLIYLENQRLSHPSHRPFTAFVIRTTRAAIRDHGLAMESKILLDQFVNLSLTVVIVADIAIDNATIVTIQINQITFDLVRDGI